MAKVMNRVACLEWMMGIDVKQYYLIAINNLVSRFETLFAKKN